MPRASKNTAKSSHRSEITSESFGPGMQDGGVVTVAMISRDACKTSIDTSHCYIHAVFRGVIFGQEARHFFLFKLLAPTFVGHFGQLFVDGRTLFILVPGGGSQLLKNFIRLEHFQARLCPLGRVRQFPARTFPGGDALA